MIVLDTGGVYDALNSRSSGHQQAVAALTQDPGPLLLPEPVLAELDYMIVTRLGQPAEEQFLADVTSGAYELASLDAAGVSACLELIKRYRDMNIGLVDASVAVVAASYRTTRVLTRGDRHFRAMKPLWGEHFTLLPADGAG